jgi:hypothetical protein
MSRRLFILAIPSVAFIGGLLFMSTASQAKMEYMKKEGKTCAFCHTAAGKKDLNGVGKCYAEHNHSLEGCGDKK